MTGDRYRIDPASRALLADLGIDAAHVLRAASLPVDLLANGPATLAQDEYFALWRATEELSDEPHLALRVAEKLSPEVFDPILFASLSARHLNDAAARIAEFKRLIGPVRLDLDVAPSGTTMTLVWPTKAVPPGLVAADAMFWVALARLATRHPVAPTAMTMPEPPTEMIPYEEFLGVAIRRGPAVSITFSAIDARRPFLTSNQAIWESFEPDLRRRLAELESGATTAERVRAVLLEALPGGDATMDGVARELAVSTRTLHRRLQEEGTTFRTLLGDTREALAMHYLADSSLSIGEISFLLGFGDTSSFFRAFRTWTGTTPDQFRARVA